MKPTAILVLITLCLPASAKPPKDTQYQDAALLSFKDVQEGSSCASTSKLKAKTDDNGDTEGSTSAETTCSKKVERHYSIRFGDSIFVLVYGYNFLNLHDVLASQFPGAHMLIRMDKKNLFVRIGNHEARYDIVEAH
jgi:hypothetical protein